MSELEGAVGVVEGAESAADMIGMGTMMAVEGACVLGRAGGLENMGPLTVLNVVVF
jgi:hypothetical protein